MVAVAKLGPQGVRFRWADIFRAVAKDTGWPIDEICLHDFASLGLFGTLKSLEGKDKDFENWY